MEVHFPDGTTVLACGRLDVVPPDRPRDPDFGLYLDARWDNEVTWPHEIVDWPDFGLPADVDAADRAIIEAWRRATNGSLVEVACDGGTGRTGTVLACFAVLAGVPSSDAVAWVRSHYHPWAVEAPEQEVFVDGFARRSRGA